MKKFKVLVAALAVTVMGAFALTPVATVGALDPLEQTCADSPGSTICENRNEDGSDLIKTVVNVLIFIVGTLAVIMIIVSGVFYAISSGDAGKVSRAKNTLTYAVVGLIVAIIAFAIVNWVIDLLPQS